MSTSWGGVMKIKFTLSMLRHQYYHIFKASDLFPIFVWCLILTLYRRKRPYGFIHEKNIKKVKKLCPLVQTLF